VSRRHRTVLAALLPHTIEGLASQAWRQSQPAVIHPPMIIEHSNNVSVRSRWPGGNEFSMVEFAKVRHDRLHERTWPGPRSAVAGPRWSYVPAGFVERLVDEPLTGEPTPPTLQPDEFTPSRTIDELADVPDEEAEPRCPACKQPYADPTVKCLPVTKHLRAWCDIGQRRLTSPPRSSTQEEPNGIP
jgi:hypothetical protein